jgi:hypothetical protein
MSRFLSLLSVMLAAAWMIGSHANADQLPSCAAPLGATIRSFPNEIPQALLKALNDKLGDVASPGQPFDATDVVVVGRNRRVIFVWKRGQRWVVATEHGGRGYNDPVLAFNLTSDGLNPSFVAVKTTFPESLCSTATELLEVR